MGRAGLEPTPTEHESDELPLFNLPITSGEDGTRTRIFGLTNRRFSPLSYSFPTFLPLKKLIINEQYTNQKTLEKSHL